MKRTVFWAAPSVVAAVAVLIVAFRGSGENAARRLNASAIEAGVVPDPVDSAVRTQREQGNADVAVVAPSSSTRPNRNADGAYEPHVGRPFDTPWLGPCDMDFEKMKLTCEDCKGDYECKPNEACVVVRDKARVACAPSNCTKDEHCKFGESCRLVSAHTNVRRCVEDGTALVGDSCSGDPREPSSSCGPTLVCAKRKCAISCDDDEKVCPKGTECREAEDGKACLPQSCKVIGCQKGETCAQIGASTWACQSRPSKDNCFENPCPKGLACVAQDNGISATYECAKQCSPLDPASCPKGQFCSATHDSEYAHICRKSCKSPYECSEKESCYNGACQPTPDLPHVRTDFK